MNFRALLLVAGSLLTFASGACGKPPDTVFIEELTWTELRGQIAAGKTTILVPLGGTEQNGPHMVLGKHNVRVRVLAEKIALALGNALVAPVMAYVPEGAIEPAAGHMRFPGTVSISPAAFEQVLESAARSLKASGFHDIVFLGDHGGYQSSEATVAARLNREWKATRARAHALPEYYAAASTAFARQLANRGYTAEEIGTHAGLADTSLALAVDPRLVRTDELAAAHDPAAGVHGDARRASAELGQSGVDAVVSQSVTAIRLATARR